MTNDGYSYAASSEMVGYKTLYSYQCDNCGGIVTGKRHKRIRGHVYCEDCKKIVYKYTKEQTLSKHWRLELMEAFKKHNVNSVEGLYEAGRSDAFEEVNSKVVSFHTDMIFRYGMNIVEARADAFDELKNWLKEQTNDM